VRGKDTGGRHLKRPLLVKQIEGLAENLPQSEQKMAERRKRIGASPVDQTRIRSLRHNQQSRWKMLNCAYPLSGQSAGLKFHQLQTNGR
jgi:hypothetical protein